MADTTVADKYFPGELQSETATADPSSNTASDKYFPSTAPATGSGKEADPFHGYVNNSLDKHFQVGADALITNIKSLLQLGFTNKSYEQFKEEEAQRSAYSERLSKEDQIDHQLKPEVQNLLESNNKNLADAVSEFGQYSTGIPGTLSSGTGGGLVDYGELQKLPSGLAEGAPTFGVTAGAMVAGAGIGIGLSAPILPFALGAGALVAGAIGAGQMINHVRSNGGDPNIARVAGLAAAAANAATMYIGAGSTTAAAKAVITKNAEGVVVELAKQMGINTTAMQATNLANAAIKYAVTLSSGGKVFKPQDINAELGTAAMSTFYQAPVWTLAGAAGGLALKTAFKGVIGHDKLVQNLTDKLNELNDQAQAQNEVDRQAKALGIKAPDLKQLSGEPPEVGTATELRKQLEDANKQVQKYEQAKADRQAAAKNVQDLQEQLAAAGKELDTLLNEPQYQTKIVNGKPTALDMRSEDLGADFANSVDKIQSKIDDLNKQITEAKDIRDQDLQPAPYTKQIGLQKELQQAETAAAIARQQQAEFNLAQRQAQAIEIAKVQEESDKANEALKAQGAVKNIVSSAIQAVRVVQKAAQNLAEGKPILEPLSSTQNGTNIKKGIGAYWAEHLPWSRTSGYYTSSPAGQLRVIFQDHPNPEPLVQQLDTFQSVQNFDTSNRQYDDLLEQHVEAATGLNQSKQAWLTFKARGTVIEGTFKGADGVDTPFKLSADQMLGYLSLMKNKKALVALRNSKKINIEGEQTYQGNNFTLESDLPLGAESTEKVFKEALDRADPNFLKALDAFKNHYDIMGNELAGLVKKNEPDRPFKLEDDYGMQIRRKGQIEATPSDLTPTRPGEEYTEPTESAKAGTPGFIKGRGGLETAIEPVGLFEATARRNRQQARYKAMWDSAKLWNELAQNPNFKSAVINKFSNGEQVYNTMMNNYQNAVHGLAQARNAWDKFANVFLKARSLKVLGFNPLYAPKHMATLYNFRFYRFRGERIPQAEMDANMRNALANFNDSAKQVLNFEDIKTRYANLNQLAALTEDEAEHPGVHDVRTAANLSLKLGDKFSVAVGGKAIYDSIYQRTGDAALAESEAVKAVNEVLASGSKGQRSPMTGHPIGQLIANLHQPQMRLAQHVREAQRLAANFPTTANIENAIRVTAENHIASFLFSLPNLAWAAGLSAVVGSNEAVQKAAYKSWTDFRDGNQFPIAGDIAKDMKTIGENLVFNTKTKVWEMDMEPFATINKTVAFAGKTVNMLAGKSKSTWDDVINDIILFNEGPGFAVPVPEQVPRVIKAVTTKPKKPK